MKNTDLKDWVRLVIGMMGISLGLFLGGALALYIILVIARLLKFSASFL